MGSFINFNTFGDTVHPEASSVQQNFTFPLVRQSSVFSLTFDEFQNTLGGGTSRDFGSMNMEELLKSIWSAEEGTQGMASSVGGVGGSIPNTNLQRQGSLTLPRTLSQRTVDEVWRDVSKETVGGGSNLETREPTLGEITLEEFLSRAGVVREDPQPSAMTNNTGIYGANVNNFQFPTQNQDVFDSQLAECKSMVFNSPNLGINVTGVMPSQQPNQQAKPQFQPLLPKQTAVPFSTSPHGNNAQLSRLGAKGPQLGFINDSKNNIVQGGSTIMGGLGNPIVKSSADTPSPSPSPYNFGEGGRGRRGAGSLEKVVERRRKRMIKNRESAARSRARKQAYQLELEAEIAKLKEMNEELRRKQEEFLKMQKTQFLETLNKPGGGKRVCLRRTLTGHYWN